MLTGQFAFLKSEEDKGMLKPLGEEWHIQLLYNSFLKSFMGGQNGEREEGFPKTVVRLSLSLKNGVRMPLLTSSNIFATGFNSLLASAFLLFTVNCGSSKLFCI
jgi:hypothetical protein